MKKMLLIGSVGCGKTTFLQRLQGLDPTYSKTQAIYTQEGISDTPGEYVDSMWFKPALRQASMEVDLVVFLQSATMPVVKIPPTFTTFFPKPVIGVVTKIDIATEEEIRRAREILQLTGVTTIFDVSSITGQGFDELAAYLH